MSLLLLRLLRKHTSIFSSFAVFFSILLISSCGGGGGDATSVQGNSSALLATQIAELQPDNDTDTSSVFVQLGTTNVPSGGAEVVTEVTRAQLQDQFLADLDAATKPRVILGISTSAPCDINGFTQQLENAHKFSSDTAVRIDLTACQLNLLKTLSNVKGVFADIPLDHQAIGTPSNTLFSNLNFAIDASFNSTASRQITADTTRTADGNGVVIAILDTGVEDRHPALGSAKVLPGACFSTASNGGASFCSAGNVVIENSQNTDPSKRVARSCANATNSGAPVWSSKQLGISAGCGHGTAMASAAAMGVIASSANTANVALNGGVAPKAMIIPIQVFNKSGNAISASSGDLLAALEWVVTEAQRRKNSGLPLIAAVNLSLGGGTYPQTCDTDYLGGLFNNAFAKLRSVGVMPVVAAGNSSNKKAVSFPACASNAFSVAATQLDGVTVASYSNFSNQVKLLAVGGDNNTNGQYVLPAQCSDDNNFDCWNSMIGTSPATALVSGGVASLNSVKPNAALSDIESALTSANTLSSKTITLNGVVKPALRLTASSYKLLSVPEPTNPVSSPPIAPPAPSTANASQGKVCFYPSSNYQGTPSCAIFNYGDWDKWYKLANRFGSIKIEPINGTTPNTLVKVTFFHYSFNFNTGLGGVMRSDNVSNLSSLGFWDASTPYIYGVRIQSP